jgi:hypothetical protein
VAVGDKELIHHIFVSHALVGEIAQDHVITDGGRTDALHRRRPH